MAGISKKKNVVFAFIIAAFILGVILRWINLNNVSMRSPDEKIYTYQSAVVINNGVKSVRFLVQEHHKNKELWAYPPPTRVGYYLPLSFVMKLMGRTNILDVEVGACMSLFFSVLSILLLIVFGLRFLNPGITLYSVVFMSVSPMDIAIARRTWQDSMAGFLGFLLIYFCCEITANSKRILWYILFVITGSYYFLVKETSLLVYGLCMLWVLWVLLKRERDTGKAVKLIAGAVLGAGISMGLLFYLTGGPGDVLKVLIHIKEGWPFNQYAVNYQSGPWYYFLEGIWIMGPVNMVLFAVGVLISLFGKRITLFFKDKDLYANNGFFVVRDMMVYTLIFTAIAVAMPHCQNIRYISTVFVPFYLIGGLGFWHIVLYLRKELSKNRCNVMVSVLIIVLFLGAMGDYFYFKNVFINPEIPDLSVRYIRENPR
ncbi:MAG: hypothetical protein ABH869_03015 [Candidatus Omnitrophota bacterium]